MLHAHSTPCIEVPPTGYGPGWRRAWRISTSRTELAIDVLEVRFGERTHRRLEPQAADDEVVIRLRQIEAGLEYLLLLVQHIEVGANANFQTEPGRIVGDLRRLQRLLEGLDLRRAAAHAGEGDLRRELRGAPGRIEILTRGILISDRLPHPRVDETPLVDEPVDLQPDHR